MGAYGNTFRASKSGVTRPLPPEALVNFEDFAVLADNWLLEDPNIKNPLADLNNDDIVDEFDLLIMSDLWLEFPGPSWHYYLGF